MFILKIYEYIYIYMIFLLHSCRKKKSEIPVDHFVNCWFGETEWLKWISDTKAWGRLDITLLPYQCRYFDYEIRRSDYRLSFKSGCTTVSSLLGNFPYPGRWFYIETHPWLFFNTVNIPIPIKGIVPIIILTFSGTITTIVFVLVSIHTDFAYLLT